MNKSEVAALTARLEVLIANLEVVYGEALVVAINGHPESYWSGNQLASALRSLLAEKRALEGLVRHAWVHSGYKDCGYEQMTAERKALYDSIVRPVEKRRSNG